MKITAKERSNLLIFRHRGRERRQRRQRRQRRRSLHVHYAGQVEDAVQESLARMAWRAELTDLL
jgi:hypothetical protein